MSALRDAFTDNAFNAALFTKVESNGVVSEQNNRLEFNYTTGYPGTAYVTEAGYVDIRNDEYKIKIVANSVANGNYLYFWFKDAAGKGAQIKLGGSGTSFIVGTLDSGFNVLSSYGDHNPAVHVWLRLRVNAGGSIVYFDYSTNGTAWTERTNTTLPAGCNAAAVQMGFGQNGSDSTGLWAVTDAYGPVLAASVTTISFTCFAPTQQRTPRGTPMRARGV